MPVLQAFFQKFSHFYENFYFPRVFAQILLICLYQTSKIAIPVFVGQDVEIRHISPENAYFVSFLDCPQLNCHLQVQHNKCK